MGNPGSHEPSPYQGQSPGEETHLGTPLVQPGQPQGAPPSFAQPPGAQPEQPPQSGPGTQPPFPAAPFAPQPGAPQPFAQPEAAPQAFAQQPGTPPPFAPPSGTPQPFAPPYGAGYAPPGTPPPFGQGGFPAPPPGPPKAKTNPVLIVGAVVVALVVAVGAVTAVSLLGKDEAKDKRPVVALPTVSAPPIPTVSIPPIDVPTLPADTGPRQVPDILKASVKTSFGTTYRRVGTASGKCPSIAPKSLRKALTKNPCIGRFKGAVYSSPKKDAVITVVIMPMKSTEAASAVKRASQYPYLIAPKKGSGVKSFGDGLVHTWCQIHTQGNLVLFSMAYRGDLGKKDKDGVANKASAELGTELSNVLIQR
ncbi:hypothetical protein [Actinocorallia sp. A-T 12471]|uniref:hypothetical protein n=1 Tax=Actinocorallia sp. A-T 12471 TaxID=3089813 RepID=UPI0029D2E51D|nr:hypothetical protein [Actinocorallia sp. A-T 12471]MDX6738196.1 hypothetical protein [Actinocorallia sp. A-T 12471]